MSHWSMDHLPQFPAPFHGQTDRPSAVVAKPLPEQALQPLSAALPLLIAIRKICVVALLRSHVNDSITLKELFP